MGGILRHRPRCKLRRGQRALASVRPGTEPTYAFGETRANAERSTAGAICLPIRVIKVWHWHCARSGPSNARLYVRLIAGQRSAQKDPAGLNKGEAQNALAQVLFCKQVGQRRDRRIENQSSRASDLNRLVAAIILWNTSCLEQVVAVDTPDEFARHIVPLGWERDDRLAPDQLRSLRIASSLLTA